MGSGFRRGGGLRSFNRGFAKRHGIGRFDGGDRNRDRNGAKASGKEEKQRFGSPSWGFPTLKDFLTARWTSLQKSGSKGRQEEVRVSLGCRHSGEEEALRIDAAAESSTALER